MILIDLISPFRLLRSAKTPSELSFPYGSGLHRVVTDDPTHVQFVGSRQLPDFVPSPFFRCHPLPSDTAVAGSVTAKNEVSVESLKCGSFESD